MSNYFTYYKLVILTTYGIMSVVSSFLFDSVLIEKGNWMGIRGLSTYIHSDNAYWTNIARIFEGKSRDSQFSHRLIIDGANLVNFLHQRVRINSLYGGQYQELYEVCTAFFLAVLNSGFHPIVVLEEIVEEAKNDTVLSRRMEKIRDLNRCVHNGEKTHILPAMGYITFSEVVADMKLETVSCDCEADKVISALAAKLGATVLSNDSDFFLTRIPSVISLNSLLWDDVLVGHFYNIDSFLQYHKLEYWAIPYIVLMLGNDTTPQHLSFLISTLRHNLTKHINGDNKVSRLIGFLSSFPDEVSLRDFMDSHLSYSHWRQLALLLKEADSLYLCPNSLVRIDPFLPNYGLAYSNIQKHSSYSLDSLLRVPWTWGIMIRRDCFPHATIQHYQRNPASKCSSFIRSYMYGILVREDEVGEYVNTSSLTFTRVPITAQHTLPDGYPLPNLDQIATIPQPTRLAILLQISGSLGVGLELLPTPWSMLAITLHYWCRHSTPSPQSSLLRLIVTSCVITFKYPTRKAYSKLLSYKTDALIRYNLLLFHQVAQWHNCYNDIYRLALVLDLPVSNPSLFYNGYLLFHILFFKEFRDTQLPKLIDTQCELWIDYLTRVIET